MTPLSSRVATDISWSPLSGLQGAKLSLESNSHIHPYMTTGKTSALTRWTFVGKVMSLLFNMLSRLVITFLPAALVPLNKNKAFKPKTLG